MIQISKYIAENARSTVCSIKNSTYSSSDRCRSRFQNRAFLEHSSSHFPGMLAMLFFSFCIITQTRKGNLGTNHGSNVSQSRRESTDEGIGKLWRVGIDASLVDRATTTVIFWWKHSHRPWSLHVWCDKTQLPRSRCLLLGPIGSLVNEIGPSWPFWNPSIPQQFITFMHGCLALCRWSSSDGNSSLNKILFITIQLTVTKTYLDIPYHPFRVRIHTFFLKNIDIRRRNQTKEYWNRNEHFIST